MATAIHDIDTMPPAHLDSDAAKFYEVVDGQVVKKPPLGVREVYPCTSKVYVYDSPTSVRILQLGDELDCERVIPEIRVPLSILFHPEEETESPDQTE